MGCIRLDILEQDFEPQKNTFGEELTTKISSKPLCSSYLFGFNGQEKDDEVTGQTGSVYTAMFWEYDARIGRRWNIDPVDKPWLSSYHAFSNNPVARIDPLGDDDYFSSNGKFLYRDNSRTDYIRIIPQEKVDELVNKYQENLLYLGKNVVHIPISVQSEFSQNSVLMSEYRWGMNIEDGKVAVAKIGKFYARSTNGYDGTENIIGQQASESLMSSGIDPYNNKIRHIGITIELPPATVSGHTHSELDNAGNLKSVLIHEKYHYENHLVKNKYNGSYAYSPKPEWEIELEAYFAQVSDETWGGTTELFRKGELDKIQGYYDKITSTEDRKKWRDDFAGKGIELK
ncbi:MAG: hypothetical protein PHE56_13760 [Bacteroidales bacterium]|nr:hypothetical protein [Bacteroidales bacterium]